VEFSLGFRRKLAKLCAARKPIMIDENTRWAPPEEIVRLARESGLTTVKIVRALSGCLSYREAREVAQEYAPLLGLSVAEFMRLRRNE
jgi:hypothetical protein